MEIIAIRISELSALMQITSELSDNPVSSECLESIFGSMSKLIPFEHCVLLHERASGSGRRTSRHEYNMGQGVAHASYAGAEADSIENYLASHNRTPAYENTFYWTPAIGKDQDPAPGRNRHGIGASISYTPSNGDGSSTALLLQSSSTAFADRHMAMIDVVIGHLHLSLLSDPPFIEEPPRFAQLTSKESEVMQWAIKGKTSWEIGKILSISERTVKFHLANIYTKFNVTNRVQAVSAATSGRMYIGDAVKSGNGGSIACKAGAAL